MKNKLGLLLLCVLFSFMLIGTVSADEPDEDFGGGPILPPQDLTSEKEWAEIKAEIAKNLTRLTAEGQMLAFTSDSVKFSWPLRAASSLQDYSYFGVSGFMDHNPNYNALLDYTCGDRTYDLSSGYDHQGSDYFTYPFPWLKMDNDEVEIIAAAAGTIVFKRDGQYDRQCGLSSASSNAVVLRHADGNYTQYLHMKENSLTSKAVGASVAVGEYLGIVGSSGSSTGPHLHFEVRDTEYEPIDPYEGSCNAVPSMWETQPPYYDSAVIAVHTGSAAPYRPPCPQQETTNTQTTFEPNDTVYFVTTYRDLLEGQGSTYSIIKPDDSLYRTWTYTSTYEHYSASYWYWAKALDYDGPPPLGNWHFEVDFQGNTYESEFYVTAPITISVLTPNGGEAWKPGTFRPIAWDTNLPEDYTEFALDLYLNDIFHTRIYTATPSDGFYFWGIPVDLPPSTNYKVQITDLGDPTIFDRSDNPFTIAPLPEAQFAYHPTAGIAPLAVTFTDTSTSLVNTWNWHFGDDLTSTLQHPTHIFLNSGFYTVTLAVTGPTGSTTLTHTDAVTVTPGPLVAAFNASPLWGTPPLTVTFSDISSGPPIDNWTWSFGDGITSTLQHPTHIYSSTGTYSVTLHVATSDEEDSHSIPDYVRVVDQLWTTYLPLVTR